MAAYLARAMGALLLLALTSACAKSGGESASSSAPATSTLEGGPLQIGVDAGGTLKVQGLVDRACRVSFGEWFENVTDDPIVITHVRFGATDGVEVLGVMKLPEGSTGVGNPPGFPPRNLRKRWPQVRELVGATIRPGESVAIVFGLQLQAERGGVSDLVLGYELQGRRYEAVDDDSFTGVAGKKSACST